MPDRPDRGYARASKGTGGFYAALPVFTDFAEFTEALNYRPAPLNWHVVVTDIEGSTKALAEGRYKDVNMVAAASIVAVTNVAGDTEIPFVFGGDGATLLIPDEKVETVRLALARLSLFAATYFDLTLRVGLVAVDALSEQGRSVRVAKFELSPGNHTALFSGGGVELAEMLVKDPETAADYSVTDDSVNLEELDLSGLSCRWEPLPAQNGVVLSLLVQALATTTEERNAAYRTSMEKIVEILGSDPDVGNPVSEKSLHFRWPPRGLELEAKAIAAGRPGWRLRVKLLRESLIQWVMNRFDLTGGGFDARRYREELRLNSDYRRFDDTLRLVVDCTVEQADRIAGMLERERVAGAVAYGAHRSDAALMTCVVFSLEQSDHVHFLDGAGGGFTSASRQLKAQLAGD